MPKMLGGPKVHNTFIMWLFSQRGEQTPMGDLARDAFADPEWNGTMTDLKIRIKETGLLPHHDTERSMEIFDKARYLYQEQRRKY